MTFHRLLNLEQLLQRKSHFLFGPRATGKSFLIREQLGDQAEVIDLLNSEIYLRLSSRPNDLEKFISDKPWTVIDEIQRVPELLNEVHRLIELKKIRFLLTGSSARKLKGDQVNLLAGRAWRSDLFPLTWKEIPKLNLDRYLRYGGLPSVYASDYPEEELRAYVKTYLYEEIQAEALVRKLPQFSRFLLTSALTSGEMVNFTEISKDAEIPASTIREYYSILEDTLVGFMVPAWTKSVKRKAISTAKFYLFDTGVTHALSQTKALDRNSNLYGKSFEQFIAMELRAFLSYKRLDLPLQYWRSVNRQEVDFVVGDELAIEVKATRRVSEKHLKGLRSLAEEKKVKHLICVSQDSIPTKDGHLKTMHWEEFLEKLWDGKILS